MTVEFARGELLKSEYPLKLGFDPYYGSFAGSIDEVLICDHAMTPNEIAAHYRGGRIGLRHLGLLP